MNEDELLQKNADVFSVQYNSSTKRNCVKAAKQQQHTTAQCNADSSYPKDGACLDTDTLIRHRSPCRTVGSTAGLPNVRNGLISTTFWGIRAARRTSRM